MRAEQDSSDGPLIVTVFVIGKLNYWKFASPFFMAYCNRHGYVLRVVQTPYDKRIFPSWNKCLALRDLPKQDFTLVMDADLIPMPNAPPILPQLHKNKMNMARVKTSRKRLERMAAEGFNPEPVWRLSSGIMGIPRSAEEMLEWVWENRYELGKRTSPGYEQEHIQQQILDREFPLNELDTRWNHVVRADRFTAAELLDVNFVHVVGGPKMKLKGIHKLFKWARDLDTFK